MASNLDPKCLRMILRFGSEGNRFESTILKSVSHITSIVSGLEQRVEKSLSFDTCRITCDVPLLDKAFLILELAVTAERTRFISIK